MPVSRITRSQPSCFAEARWRRRCGGPRAAALVNDGRPTAGGPAGYAAGLWPSVAGWEAQRGDRDAAEQALRRARQSLEAFVERNRLPELARGEYLAQIADAERKVRLAFGDAAGVLTMAKEALPVLEELRRREGGGQAPGFILVLQRQALEEAALAGLELGRFGEVEAAARALLALPLPAGDRRTDLPWIIPLRQLGGGCCSRRPTSHRAAGPRRSRLLSRPWRTIVTSWFRARLTSASASISPGPLYVQALAQPAGSRGAAQARDSLDQAARLLNALSQEARQLHDTKELISWVGAARMKPNGEAPQP